MRLSGLLRQFFEVLPVCPNPLSPPGNVIILVCRPVVATWGTSVDSSLLVSNTRPSPFASTSLMHAHTNAVNLTSTRFFCRGV